jgi:hypothetical protein
VRYRKLFDWRLQRPDGCNRLIKAGNAAVIVHQRWRGRLKEACIIELIWDRKDIGSVKKLIKRVKIQLKPNILTTILTPDHPDIITYRSLGFLSKSNNSNFVVAPTNGKDSVPGPDRWALSGFDLDTF